jgi:dsRNA-specific ribonuclease
VEKVGDIKIMNSASNSTDVDDVDDRAKNILISYGLPPIVSDMTFYKTVFLQESSTSEDTRRLRYLGIGVLRIISKLYLFKRFPTLSEKELESKEINLLQYQVIRNVANKMGFAKVDSLYALLGAILLDFNGYVLNDEKHHWFRDLFVSSGPGFQMVEVFVENVFDTHVNWVQLNDNKKERLRVMVQSKFGVNPFYYYLQQQNQINIYLCFGGVRFTHDLLNYNIPTLVDIYHSCFHNLEMYLESTGGKGVILLGTGYHHSSKTAAERRAEHVAMKNLRAFYN